jgi:uncharacterized membrane protein
MQEADQPRPSPEDCTMASLAHALQIVGSFIAPLIIFFIRRESKFVAFHALQALLLQLLYMALWFLMFAILMVAVVTPAIIHDAQRDRSEDERERVEQKAEETPSQEKAGDASKAESDDSAEPEKRPPAKRANKRKGEPPPVWFMVGFLLFWPLYMIAWVSMLVAAIVYCIKAGRGEWAAYPVVGRWARKLLNVAYE